MGFFEDTTRAFREYVDAKNAQQSGPTRNVADVLNNETNRKGMDSLTPRNLGNPIDVGGWRLEPSPTMPNLDDKKLRDFRDKALRQPSVTAPQSINSEVFEYTYKNGDTFAKVLVDNGLSDGTNLWGPNGDVAFYEDQLKQQGITGNIPEGTTIRLTPRYSKKTASANDAEEMKNKLYTDSIIDYLVESRKKENLYDVMQDLVDRLYYRAAERGLISRDDYGRSGAAVDMIVSGRRPSRVIRNKQ